MSFETPDDRRYLDTHEWIRLVDDGGTVGITDFAQYELGDVVFFELPEVGDRFDRGAEFGVIESLKATSSLYMPMSGEVVEVNANLADHPELVNDDPYGEGWIITVHVDDPGEFDSLLTATEYDEAID